MKKITALTIVKNEQYWLWYALNSVVDQVDKILVWDTGSTDKTVDVIKSIVSPKIKFKECGPVNASQFTVLRQQMLEQCDSDWVMILDGDEIWTARALSESLAAIESNPHLEFLVNSQLTLVGDIFHYQPSSASRYKIGPYSGHINIRFVNRRIPGLHFDKPYGHEGFFDSHSTPIQNRTPSKMQLIHNPYLHSSHLKRSPFDNSVMQRPKKFKHELGKKIRSDFAYPASFYRPPPLDVPSVWKTAGFRFFFPALLLTPFRHARRLKSHA